MTETDDRNPMLEALDVPESLEERAYKQILNGILTGKLPAGMPLVEADLAQQLGISKTPVRAALQRLETELFLKSTRKHRHVVTSVSKKDLENAYLVRSRLEGLAAFLAAQYFTPEDIEFARKLVDEAHQAALASDAERAGELASQFHELLWTRSKNHFLCDSLRRLGAHIARGRVSSASHFDSSIRCNQGHRSILEAIASSDPELAEKRMRDHVLNSICDSVMDHPDNDVSRDPFGDQAPPMTSEPDERLIKQYQAIDE